MDALSRYLADRFEISHGKNPGFPSMEGLRGFAVFLVFLVHFFSLSEPWLPPVSVTHDVGQTLWRIGNTGVDLFFVLSGYLIYGTLITKARPFIPYLRRRIERIYPTFLVVFAVYVAGSLAMPANSRIPGDPGSAILYLLQNLLMLPGMFAIEPIITVAWSLSYEVFYYLAIPLLIIVLRLRRWTRIQRIALFAALGIGIFIYSSIFNHYVRLVMFVAGILLFESPSFRATSLTDRLGLGTPLVVFLSILVARDGGGLWRYIWLCVAYYLLCYAAFREEGRTYRIFTWTPMRWLGNMSYSYYLIHGLALNVAFTVFARLFPPNADTPWIFGLALAPMFALTLIPSTFLFLAVERPYSLMPHRRPDAPHSLAVPAPNAGPEGFFGNVHRANGENLPK